MKTHDYKCEFCLRSFQRENTFLTHMCPKKQRWLDKDNRIDKLAFMTWLRFYKKVTPNAKREPDFRKFIDSRYYNQFIQLAKFIFQDGFIDSEGYVDHLISNGVHMKDWTTESEYNNHVKKYLLNESPHNAITRSIQYIQTWCNDTGFNLTDFFANANTNQQVQAIRTGKLSPWILYISANGNKLLERFDSSQFKLMNDILDPVQWKLRIKRHTQEIIDIREVLEQWNI